MEDTQIPDDSLFCSYDGSFYKSKNKRAFMYRNVSSALPLIPHISPIFDLLLQYIFQDSPNFDSVNATFDYFLSNVSNDALQLVNQSKKSDSIRYFGLPKAELTNATSSSFKDFFFFL